MSDSNRAFGIFAKYPHPGKVKTRLAKNLGEETACELYRAFLGDLVSRLGTHFQKQCVLCFTPDDSDSNRFFGILSDLAEISHWPQPEGDLGTRLSAFFDEQFQRGTEKAIVIGSDSPTLPVPLVENAFEQLSHFDCVLGPSVDGGFYLLGLSHFVADIFQDIDWSTTRVLEQVVTQIEKSNTNFSLLPPWYDVDSLDDLRFLRGHLQALELSGEKDLPTETIRFLDRYSTDKPDRL